MNIEALKKVYAEMVAKCKAHCFEQQFVLRKFKDLFFFKNGHLNSMVKKIVNFYTSTILFLGNFKICFFFFGVVCLPLIWNLGCNHGRS